MFGKQEEEQQQTSLVGDRVEEGGDVAVSHDRLPSRPNLVHVQELQDPSRAPASAVAEDGCDVRVLDEVHEICCSLLNQGRVMSEKQDTPNPET